MGEPKKECRWYKPFEYVSCYQTYRIYIRSKNKGRGFTPVGYYCPGHKIFEPDKAMERRGKYFPTKPQATSPKFKDHKITPKEAGLRTRVRSLKGLYKNKLSSYLGDKQGDTWPEGLTEKFLSLPPSIMELKHVLLSNELTYKINSQNQYRSIGWVPDPDKPGWMKYDYQKYKKLLKQDMLKQQEMMRQIIASRTSA